MARRAVLIALSLLGTVLLGITLVLSSISFFLHIDDAAYLTEDEVPWPDPLNVSFVPVPGEQVPRIIHQTWKDDVLPERWRGVSQGCRDLMPDYEYMLWTDASSRTFIEEHYEWFLPTFDAYPYPIQRADAIRYFVLYHYGGAYLDLDVGCLRRLDPLLHFPAILPKTKPVGVSNDLMLISPLHPFMRQAIDGLQGFDHNWIMNYPTVMFSTGPMFLSAQYGLYTAAAGYPRTPAEEVRVLPKPLYGKNAKAGEAPHAFFSHYYGSSWHADDAGLVLFLGTYGRVLMYAALAVLLLGAARLLYTKHKSGAPVRARFGRYEVLVPRVYADAQGRHRIDLGPFSISQSPSTASESASPYASSPASPSFSEPILPLSVDVPRSPSPTSSSSSYDAAPHSPTADALRWAITIPSRVLSHLSSPLAPHFPHKRQRRRRGVLFFLPAVFHPHGHGRSLSRHRSRHEVVGDDGIPLSEPLLSPTVSAPPPYDPSDDVENNAGRDAHKAQ